MIIIIKIERNELEGFDVVEYSTSGRLCKITTKELNVAHEYIDLMKEECGLSMFKLDEKTWRIDLLLSQF